MALEFITFTTFNVYLFIYLITLMFNLRGNYIAFSKRSRVERQGMLCGWESPLKTKINGKNWWPNLKI